VFEINNGNEVNVMTGSIENDMGFFNFENVMKKYHTVGVRRLRNTFRDNFVNYVMSFYRSHMNLKFNKKIFKFVGGWTSLPFETNVVEDGVFCTEMMAMCYEYCFNDRISSILSIPPLMRQTCIPRHYTYSESPMSKYFAGPEVLFMTKPSSVISRLTFITSILLILFLVIILVIVSIVRCAKDEFM